MREITEVKENQIILDFENIENILSQKIDPRLLDKLSNVFAHTSIYGYCVFKIDYNKDNNGGVT